MLAGSPPQRFRSAPVFLTVLPYDTKLCTPETRCSVSLSNNKLTLSSLFPPLSLPLLTSRSHFLSAAPNSAVARTASGVSHGAQQRAARRQRNEPDLHRSFNRSCGCASRAWRPQPVTSPCLSPSLLAAAEPELFMTRACGRASRAGHTLHRPCKDLSPSQARHKPVTSPSQSAAAEPELLVTRACGRASRAWRPQP